MKRVLFVLETSGASGQDNNRALIYRSLLQQAGIHADFIGCEPQHAPWALNPSSPLTAKLAKSLEYQAYAQAKFKVLRPLNIARILRAARQADAIYLIKAHSLELVKKIRAVSRARLVYDFGDALWLPTYSDSYKEIEAILGQVDAVTCDNRFGVDYAQKFCKEVILWDSYPQIESFDRLRGPKPSTQGKPLTIGWLGSPGTMYNLYAVWEALETVFKRNPSIHMSIVGGGTNRALLPPFENIRFSVVPTYSNDEMFPLVLAMDIGIFPMFNTENAKVRGVMKALVYMSGGAAVVCSPQPLCSELIRDGENGFLAGTHDDWIQKLELLIRNAALREKVSAQAVQMIRERYPMKRIFGELRQFLKV